MDQALFENKVMKVTYDMKKGLNLSWIFKGIPSYECQFKHLFIVQSCELQLATQFLEFYIKNIKLGDLYRVTQSLNTLTKSQWYEKTKNQQTQNWKLSFKSQSFQSLLNFLKTISIDYKNYSDTMIINIFSQKIWDKDKIKLFSDTVENLREDGGLQFIINILGNQQNSMSCSSGINYLNLNLENYASVGKMLLSYINNLGALTANIELQCLNGTLNLQSIENWYNLDFNTIKKKYYGGLIKDLIEEQLLIINYSRKVEFYHFKLKISYTLMNQGQYVSIKQFKLTSPKCSLKNFTTYQYRVDWKKLTFKGIQFEVFPFKQSISIQYRADCNTNPLGEDGSDSQTH